MGKLATPDWITEGFDSKADWEKAHGASSKKKKTEAKVFKIRKCPKCGSDKVNVVLSNRADESDDEELETSSSKGQTKEWECKKCKWHGKNIDEEELTEDEFMKYLDEQGEEVA